MKEKKKHSFIIKYIIFCIILVGLTMLAINKSIEYIEENTKEEVIQEKPVVEPEILPITAKDKQYGIQNYEETYDNNSLKITHYYSDVKGKIFDRQELIYDYTKKYIHYIQIEGLKNKNIQNNINEKLKQKAFDLKDDKNNVDTWETANFSNILSVRITSDNDKIDVLNVDLTTGNDIPLEKIFVSSAPLNNYLAEGLYKTLAWKESEKEEYEEIHDMNNYDTSEYEDKFLILINNYNRMKDNIKFNISPSGVDIYGLLDDKVVDKENETQYNSIKIEFLEHIEEVAIYKRYLTDQSIYEDDNIGAKGIIVLTTADDVDDYMKKLTYEKKQDNIFVEEVIQGNIENLKENSSIYKYIKNLSDKNIKELEKRNLENKGMFFQRIYYLNENEEEQYYSINISTVEATCTRDYFEKSAFKDYCRVKLLPTADVTLLMFDSYMKDNFPNMEISETKFTDIYVSKDGKFLGNTEEEAREKLQTQN